VTGFIAGHFWSSAYISLFAQHAALISQDFVASLDHLLFVTDNFYGLLSDVDGFENQ